jgi:excisionase family DNA binding protein
MTQGRTTDLTVPQVAERLGMTPDGVYKLIQRGKLDAVRVSARKTRVSETALERYIGRQQAAVERFRTSAPVGDPESLRERFVAETSRSPEDWLTAFKRDEIEDTPENMRLLVRAVALHRAGGHVPVSDPEAHPWAVAAFAMPRGRD